MSITVKWYRDSIPIWGAIPNLPVVVPPNVIRWKIRQRPEGLAMIYLRTEQGIEQWILVEKDGALIPGLKQSENRRGKQ